MRNTYREREEEQTASLTLCTEQRLISLAKDGDKAAFAELYQLHAHRVFHAVLRITRNHEDAEDVLQEASLKAFIHLKGFDGRSKFSTWLTRIAINTALMMLRKTRGRIEFTIGPEYESGILTNLQLIDETPDPEHRALTTERSVQLNRAVRLLPWALRESLELQLAEELSVKDLANRQGISVSAAKSRLFRAKRQARQSMVRFTLSKAKPVTFVSPTTTAQSRMEAI
ncbi:RNA polymerase sigma factor [Acidicapsa ligni]|uniref:RNA polymerase sigma factor n=1 Tax=Acidicapsa ligni TaxID=542300 RepID=UPI0021E09AC7|nr:sigma-70 family RNA polymerase sigma factor [Acidicapsa ligni]